MKQTILAVDDTPENLDILKGILTPDYTLKVAIKGEMALKIARNQQPDLILLDIMMPEMDGYEVCRILKSDPKTAPIPVVFVTAMSETTNERTGFEVGAVDYITKPVQPDLVRARVKTHLALSDQQRTCRMLVKRRTEELEKSQRAAIDMLGEAGHFNDTDTGVHIWRMADFCGALARAIGWSVERAEMLELAAPMHDTGKLGISDTILKAPRKLTRDEFEIIKTHTTIGYDILKKSTSPLFTLAAEVALHHHEKWDGSGYPHGLVGEEISEASRIVALADVFDALSMHRPYKEAWPLDKVFEIILKDAGTHFDPHMAETFVAIRDQLESIKSEWDAKEQQEVGE
ncbi:MAG: response regulator [Magnetococcales bacterium]|nr:response regulator [Magnetococcales bacterium]